MQGGINTDPDFGAKMFFEIFFRICLMLLARRMSSCSTTCCIGMNSIQGSKELLKIVRWVGGVNFYA